MCVCVCVCVCVCLHAVVVEICKHACTHCTSQFVSTEDPLHTPTVFLHEKAKHFDIEPFGQRFQANVDRVYTFLTFVKQLEH